MGAKAMYTLSLAHKVIRWVIPFLLNFIYTFTKLQYKTVLVR